MKGSHAKGVELYLIALLHEETSDFSGKENDVRVL